MHQYAYDRSSRTYSADGALHVTGCRISKANICPYYGWEIPNNAALGLQPSRLYRLYRDPAELAAAADTFRNLPLLIRHVPVTPEQPAKDSWVGSIGSTISFDGTYLVADLLTVQTADAIGLVEAGAQEELSSSYRYTADMTPGNHPTLGAYDGVMRNIIGNHVAIVEEGRAGSDVRINDALPLELRTMHTLRRARLLAAAIALGITAPSAAQLVAMDGAIPRAADECEAWDGWSADARARAMDAWRSETGCAADAALSNEQESAAWDWAKDKAPQYQPVGRGAGAASDQRPAPAAGITQEQLTAAVQLAADTARSQAAALYDARTSVRPFVGEVLGCDSADGVYRFALEQLGVKDAKTVHTSALAALFGVASQAKAAGTARPPAPVAMDATRRASVAKAIPGLANITLAA